MADYIEREKLLRDIDKYHVDSSGKFHHWVEIQPAADVAPVRHGRLLRTGLDEYYGKWAECSGCGWDNPINAQYCNGCGAKMDGGEESEED